MDCWTCSCCGAAELSDRGVREDMRFVSTGCYSPDNPRHQQGIVDGISCCSSCYEYLLAYFTCIGELRDEEAADRGMP